MKSHRHSQYPCTIATLKRVVSRNVFSEVAAKTPDPRRFYELAAEAYGIQESDLMRFLAKELKIPYVETIDPVDVSAAAPSISLVSYRRVGAIPKVVGGKITGAIAVNPRSVESFLDRKYPNTVQIAPWYAISYALWKSEELFRHKPLPHAYAEEALSLIQREAQSYGSKEVYLCFEEAEWKYQFRTPQGKLAIGGIASRVTKEFSSLLETLSERDAEVARTGDGTYVIALRSQERTVHG